MYVFIFNPLLSQVSHSPTQVLLDPLNASFATPLLHRLHHSIDILIFNPPYVPTESLEVLQAQGEMSISSSWAGGIDGMEVTNTFLPMVMVLAA